MNDSIRLSPKHGVNPGIDQCPICGNDVGIVLFGLLPNDKEAPHKSVITNTVCQQCNEHMKIGIIAIEADTSLTTDRRNPYRTGRIFVLKESAIKKLITNEELQESILEKRVTYIEKGLIP
jgi:CRISPR/Cas system-associated protein Cas10 (large subunit of type III CRISPR-Cas system)